MNRNRHHQGGFTIVELLVASTVGLLLVMGVIEAFRQITTAVTRGRANVQLSVQLRNATNLLRQDFQGITVPAIPNTSTDSGAGYFEIIEGQDNDLITSATDTLSGDTDDVIMFTSRRLGEPFSGRVVGGLVASARPSGYETITSPNAEIIYWLEPRNTEFLRDGADNDGNGNTDEPAEGYLAPLQHNGMPLATLRRRALLIRPDLNNNLGVIPGYTAAQIGQFLNDNDISVRVNLNNDTISANSLSDLTLRQNRIAHVPSADMINTNIDLNFPFAFEPSRLPFQSGIFMGEDVVFDQVISFDIRVYDPLAKVVQDITGSEPLVPGDPGYETQAHTAIIGRGAYIDLGFASRLTNLAPAVRNQLGSLLSQKADSRAQLNGFTPPLYPVGSGYFTFGNCSVYDTWTIEYERDGLDQDRDGIVDEGMDGFDNNPLLNAGVDDTSEREAPPPYPPPLRGFQVIVRAFQNGQQQTRQFTINHDFTPE
ncbi:MAG: prepilin-type N-terminal cleavage/methylation domain-containing protein [Planctomycetota bacterium]|nr:prepilin-type N-terminal cleavage/methylation domain-containing protein [Planctomycetota bacterium]